MHPFERFTEQAKRTLTLAQEEAEKDGRSYIGTEHLLIGVLRLQAGTAYRALENMGISPQSVRSRIEFVLGTKGERVRAQQLIPTSRVKRVIELAFEESRRTGHNFVDTGQLLIALALEGEGIAALALNDLGGTPPAIRAAVEREMAEPVRPQVPTLEVDKFREIMSTFPSGVVVLTAFGEDGGPRGLTVSAFCAASLHPPLVLVCIDKTSNTLPAVQHAGGFTANILATGRDALARRMATKLSEKFEGIAWRRPESALGGPILEADSAAYAVCALRDTIEAGDHWVLIGQVTDGDHREGVTPMVFTRRVFS